MGANWFQIRSRGNNVQDAYNKAVDHANDVHGHQDGYSGEINSTCGFRDVTKEANASKKDYDKYIEDSMDKLTKHQGAQAICIQEPRSNDNKIKSQVEHIVEHGTKKWVLKYVAKKGDFSKIGSYLTKGEAVTAARKYTEKSSEYSYVEMQKVLEKGKTKVAEITYKKSSTERDGEWVFFGWASY